MSLTHILLVEDNPGDVFLVRSLLGETGDPQAESHHFRLSHVDSLEKGLSLLEEDCFDVVLLDLNLPDCCGIEGLRRMREKAPNLPIVVLTGLDDEAFSVELVQQGAQDYLIKGKISHDWLKSTINHAIARSQRSQVLGQSEQKLHQSNQTLQSRLLDSRHQLDQMREQLNVLEERSSTDALTGIANRYALEEFFEKEWFQARRDSKPIALIMMDIDYFKQFNDSNGHQQGDRCLKMIAQTFKRNLHRPKDLVARYGGEEFAAILPNTELAGAVTIATQLGKAIRNLAIDHPDSKIGPWVTVSFGVAKSTPRLASSPADLIREADRALYLSKAAGRNCVTHLDPPKIVTRSMADIAL